jgi:hypothetical protein
MSTLEIKCFEGDPWSPSGMGDGDTATLYSVATETFDVTEDTDTLQLWFAGKGSGCSGPRTTLIASAYITQGGKSTPVSVRGQYSNFVVPPTGCWSDAVSVADFTLPGTVSFIVNYVEATNVPTFSDNAIPTDPVPISALRSVTIEGDDIIYNDSDTISLKNGLDGTITWKIGDGSNAGVTLTEQGDGVLANSGASLSSLSWLVSNFLYNTYTPLIQSFEINLTINVSALELGTIHADSTMMWIGSFPSAFVGICFCSDVLGKYDEAGYSAVGGAVAPGTHTVRVIFTRNGSTWNVSAVVDGTSFSFVSTVGSTSIGFTFHTYTAQRTMEISSLSALTTDTTNLAVLPWKDELDILSGWGDAEAVYSITDGVLKLDSGWISKYIHSHENIEKYTMEIVANIGAEEFSVSLYGELTTIFCVIHPSGFTVYGTLADPFQISASISSGQHTFRFEGDNSITTTLRIYLDDVYCGETIINTEPYLNQPPTVLGLGAVTGSVYISEISIVGTIDGSGTLTEVKKSGSITINTNPSPGDTLTISNSATTVFTFVDHYPNNATEIQIGATTVVTAQALATAINNISGAEFVATVDGSIISVDAYCESAFTMTTTSTGIEISSITEIVPGLITEIATAADSFTASDGGKAVQENATAADSTDGLIDGIVEAASVSTVFDTLNVEMDESIEATVVTDFDGLIEYMGEEI